MQTQPICMECKHYLPRTTTDKPIIGYFHCEAYSDSIPKEIITGKVDHHYPYKGDNGIQFEPVDDTTLGEIQSTITKQKYDPDAPSVTPQGKDKDLKDELYELYQAMGEEIKNIDVNK